MQNQNKKQPSSRLKSFYLSCRRHLSCSNSSSSIRLAINPTLLPRKVSLPLSLNNRRTSTNSPFSKESRRTETVADGNFRRVCDLETELQELEEWLCSELTRLKSHLGSTSDNNDNIATNNDNGERGNKFERLDLEGSYLYTSNGNKIIIDGDSQDLSIQISSPAVLPNEPGSATISEVLNKMADMGKEKLMSWLLESMPMTDISTTNITGRSHVNSNTTPNNVLEAILTNAIDKLHDLVIEGLQIQMGTKEVVKWQQEAMVQAKEEAQKEVKDGANEGSIISVVLIQARDPKIGYQPVNEMMIGLIEARNAEKDEEAGFSIQGVYVAGLVARRTNGEVIHNCLWCVSS
ncbi:uncharacterized protein LOC141591200 [Silene latifolia]|uniref:uncharacterized protein LOC141591200 n=1 Tax=Silene latifolia TaxID=37657 RepID=UPI003D76DAFB